MSTMSPALVTRISRIPDVALCRRSLELALQCGARRPTKDRTLAAQYYARREPAIARLREAIVRVLDLAKADALRRLRRRGVRPLAAAEAGAGVTAEVAFDLPRFRGQLLATIRSESAATLQESGEQLFAEIGRTDPFAMPNPKALAFLDERENLLAGIADDVHEQIVETIESGMSAGKNSAQIARDIREKFAAVEGARADTIASTETAVAYGVARQEGFLQAGVKFKRWLTSHLPNVREAHGMAEDDERNQRVPVEEPFHVGGELLLYPGDPSGSAENVINCNCVALALEDAA